MKNFKHKCGCVTKKREDGIEFLNICTIHKSNGKFMWLGVHLTGDNDGKRPKTDS